MLFHLSTRTSVLVPQHLGTHTNNHYSGNLVLIASRKHWCKDEGADSNNYVSKLKYTLYACIGLYVQYIRTIDAETSTFTEGMVYGPQVNPYLSVFCVWQTDIPQSLLPFLVCGIDLFSAVVHMWTMCGVHATALGGQPK